MLFLLFKWLPKYYKNHIGRLLLVTTLILSNAVVLVFIPDYTRKLIDNIKTNPDIQALTLNAFYIITLGILHFIITAYVQSNRAYLNIHMERDIRDDTFAHLTQRSPSFFQQFRTGDLVTRLTDDLTEKSAGFYVQAYSACWKL